MLCYSTKGRRAKLINALSEAGYEFVESQGTFYLWVKSPVSNERLLVDALAEDNVFVLDGTSLEYPGYVRLSLTATDAMVDRALGSFASAKAKLLSSASSSPNKSN